MKKITKGSTNFMVTVNSDSKCVVTINNSVFFNYVKKDGKWVPSTMNVKKEMNVLTRLTIWASKNNVDNFDSIGDLVGLLRACGTESVWDIKNCEWVPVADACSKPGEFLYAPNCKVSPSCIITVWAKDETEAKEKLIAKISNKQKTVLLDNEMDQKVKNAWMMAFIEYMQWMVLSNSTVIKATKERENLDLRLAEDKLGINIPNYIPVRKTRDEKEGEQITANTAKRGPGRPRRNAEVVNG